MEEQKEEEETYKYSKKKQNVKFYSISSCWRGYYVEIMTYKLLGGLLLLLLSIMQNNKNRVHDPKKKLGIMDVVKRF